MTKVLLYGAEQNGHVYLVKKMDRLTRSFLHASEEKVLFAFT